MIIRGTRVLTDRGMRTAAVHVHNGRITDVSAFSDIPPGSTVVDAGDDVVMPGLVDTHVHVNEPGRTEWEGFATATRAAAAGGVTTLFDMPLNSIPATTSVRALESKQEAAARSAIVNVGFTGGVVPGNAGDIAALYRAGVRLFKCFLVPSGVEEFPCVSESDLDEALPILADVGATLMVHAELPERIVVNQHGDPRSYYTYLASRPPSAEMDAVAMMIRLAERYGAHVHIVHVSSPETVTLIRDARARGVVITAETCPHYLTFTAEGIADGATAFKCAPPIRSSHDREGLWRAVIGGGIDMIVSDHSPCPPVLKSLDTGDFFQAWGGIASLQLGLPAVWTEGSARGMSVEMLAAAMCLGPARLAGLADRKGRLATGYDADIVIWNPDESFAVTASALYHRHAITPYDGRTLTGVVRATYVAGVEACRNGTITRQDPIPIPRLHPE